MAYGQGFLYVLGAQILFFIITIILIIWFVKSSKQKETITAKDILNNRLASGKINRKEYDLLMKKINKEEKK